MKPLAPIVMAAALFALAACDEEPDEFMQAENVVDAAGVWPPAEYSADVEEFDPLRTRTNLQVVVDFSGSMKDQRCAGDFASKAQAARTTFDAWLAGVPEEANVGLITFSGSRARVDVPLGRGEANREALTAAMEAARPSGKTPLSDSVALAQQELERQAAYQQGYGAYRLVVITDGEHTDGYDPRPVVEGILMDPANPIEIHTIGFCIEDSALNLPGRTFYQSASDPAELKAGLEGVLAESESFDVADFEALKDE